MEDTEAEKDGVAFSYCNIPLLPTCLTPLLLDPTPVAAAAMRAGGCCKGGTVVALLVVVSESDAAGF